MIAPYLMPEIASMRSYQQILPQYPFLDHKNIQLPSLPLEKHLDLLLLQESLLFLYSLFYFDKQFLTFRD